MEVGVHVDWGLANQNMLSMLHKRLPSEGNLYMSGGQCMGSPVVCSKMMANTGYQALNVLRDECGSFLQSLRCGTCVYTG